MQYPNTKTRVTRTTAAVIAPLVLFSSMITEADVEALYNGVGVAEGTATRALTMGNMIEDIQRTKENAGKKTTNSQDSST